jgi:uncharacterized protein
MDDLDDYRPGRRALQELGVRSPLIEAGLGKSDIRDLSHRLRLDTWNKPALACLLTRFTHGAHISRERLEMVERCEDFLREKGFGQFRVRVHDDNARIELAENEMPRILETDVRDEITAFFRQAGFKFISLDLAGYRCGSMN